MLQVVRRNKPIDYVLTGASFIGYAMPAFLLGQLLILYFAIDLKWFGVEAPQANSIWGILSDPRDLVLPVLTLSRDHDRGVQPLHALVDDGGDDARTTSARRGRRARASGGCCTATRCGTR